jgi:hypothetical protein
MKAGVAGTVPLPENGIASTQWNPFLLTGTVLEGKSFVLTEGNEFLVQKKAERTFWQLLDFEISAQEYLR